jgi:hypothetical protein
MTFGSLLKDLETGLALPSRKRMGTGRRTIAHNTDIASKYTSARNTGGDPDIILAVRNSTQ